MRCRDGEGGPVVREQELQQGKFMGVVRYYKDGALEREYRVNERGNRDGVLREWARPEAGAQERAGARGDAARRPQRRHRPQLVPDRPAAPGGGLRRRRARAGERRVHGARPARPTCAARTQARARQRLRRPRRLRLRRRPVERDALQRQGRGRRRGVVLRARRAAQERDALGKRRGARAERGSADAAASSASFAADGTKRREQQWIDDPRRAAAPA